MIVTSGPRSPPSHSANSPQRRPGERCPDVESLTVLVGWWTQFAADVKDRPMREMHRFHVDADAELRPTSRYQERPTVGFLIWHPWPNIPECTQLALRTRPPLLLTRGPQCSPTSRSLSSFCLIRLGVTSHLISDGCAQGSAFFLCAGSLGFCCIL